ncbi:MAG: penicillin-binding protein 2 [Pseudomonadota bacterium]|nr:penicillin-binding protein 2 [Pseudomonadota bacterium]
MSKKVKQKENRRVTGRRTFLLGSGMLLATSFLSGRLYQLQVAQNNRYKRLSDRNQFDWRVVPPRRGRLVDRQERLLAGNAESYLLHITPLYAGDVDKSLAQLASLIELNDEVIGRVREQARKGPSFRPILIRESLTQRELSTLAIRSAYLPGVTFEKSLRRIYPQGALTGHVTGYVSPLTSREIEENSSLGDLPDLATGKIGIEYALEPELRGTPGGERVEVNARGRPIRVFRDFEPEPGGDVKLALDIGLQQHVTEILRRGQSEPVDMATAEVQRAIAGNRDLKLHLASGENMLLRDSIGNITPPESGAVVVMDIRNGEILSMVSSPTYDPNVFTDRLLTRDWRRLNEHPRNPLLNRVTAGLYAPGSTFKMVVALAALEAGIINERTSFSCKGSMELGNATFHCWLEDGHGTVNVVRALERSCDVFFYEVALKTGIQRIKAMANKLGLGDVTGIDIPGEKQGIIPHHEWKLATHGVVWTPGETVVASIGQGYVLVTPLQLAVMTARLASGTKAVTPSLQTVDGVPEFAELDISLAALRIVHKGMLEVTNGSLGTARAHNLPSRLGGMAGKTGTVQVKRITKEQREAGITKNIERPWKERDHALFVGYAPIKDPRYAVAVVVEHGGSGSSMAAPIAKAVLKRALETEGKA